MLIKNCDKTIFAFSDTHGNHQHQQVPEDAEMVEVHEESVELQA